MFVIVIPSLIVPSYVGMYAISEEIEKKSINALQQNGIFIMDSISKLIYERTSDLQFITEKNSILNNESISISDKIEYLRSLERSSKMYSTISIYDESGLRIGDTRNIAIGHDFSNEEFFIESKKGNLFYSATPVYDKILNQHVLHFSGPLYLENGNFYGVVDLIFPTFKIHEIFENVSPQINLDLVSSEEELIFSNYVPIGSSSISPNFEKLSVFDSLNEKNETFENDDKFYVISTESGFLTYPGNGWKLVQSVQTDWLYHDSNNLKNLFFMVSVIIAIVSIILMINFSISFSKPILNLNSAIKKIQEGDLDVIVKPTGSDELIELANSFNKMTRTVRDSQNELHALDKHKTEFVSMIAHELKNPLVPIMGYCDIISNGTLGSLTDKQKNALNIILKNSLTLESITSDLLDLEKLELGKINLNIKKISTTKLLESVKLDQETLSKNKGVSIIIKQKNDLNVNADFNRLKQIFNNFILNSYEFLKIDSEQIEIGSYLENNEIIFYVKDDGIGIPEEKLGNLFEKFYQVDTTITRKHGGSGLGLSICKGLIEAHNGKVWCESKISKGTIFYFSIPLSENIENITN